MSAEKTESVILSAAAYRETSCILKLFTKTRGLVHGIAKGIRKGGKSSVPIDRGFILETLLYHKPNRDLHTLGDLHIANFFPGIRADITKSAVRDVALELYMKTITQHGHPHPELYDLMTGFLEDVDEQPKREALFPALWRFIYRYCLLEGFGISEKNCETFGMTETVVKFVCGEDGGDDSIVKCPHREDRLYITELMLRYCQSHFDIRGQFNSLEFVRSM